MSFVPHSFDDRPRPKLQQVPMNHRVTNSQLKKEIPSNRPVTNSRVEKLPLPSPKIPGWLGALFFIQKGSSITAFALVSLTLVVYAWTVYTQQLWSKEYKKLEYLQSIERQLVKALTGMENYHAQQAEKPESGLRHSRPLVLPPSSEEPTIRPAQESTSKQVRQDNTPPLGY
ncbi:MAG: hypothetical protein WA865_16390 [Spirulinaceae cyanobacterium]